MQSLSIRSRAAVGVAAATLALGGAVAFAAPASASQASQERPAAAAQSSTESVKTQGGPDRWDWCGIAPQGSLVFDFKDGGSVCWSGSGKATNPDRGVIEQMETANNKGHLTYVDASGTGEKRLDFGRYQHHELPDGAVVLDLTINT